MKKVIVKFVLLYFFLINFCYADLLKPSSKLKPIDVLTIQLNSLKRNDTPYKDAGIEQTWEFAHPVNKLTTGPLERFKKMIYSKNYEILLNHENFKITVLNKTEMNSVFKVLILS